MATQSAVMALRPALAAAAQAQYAAWEQDAEGWDEEVGSGGICHLIAESMAGVLGDAGVQAWTTCANDEVHVYCVALAEDGVLTVDVPWRTYERGGGYTWTKIPGVVIGAEDVQVRCIDADPGNIALYAEAD